MENTSRKRYDVIDKDKSPSHSCNADRDADAEALLSEPKINRVGLSELLWKGGRGGIEIDNK
jgi:hypothetical protein